MPECYRLSKPGEKLNKYDENKRKIANYKNMAGNLLSRPIIRETGAVIVLKVIFTVLSFLFAVVFARLLGAEGYGIYAYALFSLLALPAQAGMPNLIVRETAKGVAQNRPDLIKGVWNWSGRITAVFSFILAVGAGLVL